MPHILGLHGASLLLVRHILDEFCKDHSMDVSDAKAIDAARLLMALAVSHHEDPDAMRQGIEEWFSRSEKTKAAENSKAKP